MSAIHYSWRSYKKGDERAINILYERITGRTRTIEQWSWQWQQAPGGAGDIWLIEANHPDGRVELIGHHGIMPIRFNCGEQDLLFGKTENTMVLPEYREKILYPRFEMRFASIYEPRYHALFSTMGPAAAIRQRKTLGYVSGCRWYDMEFAIGILASMVKVARRPRFLFLRSLLGTFLQPRECSWSTHGVRLLTAEQARTDSFLQSFWLRSRANWGIAPSRCPEDLAWRYWDNPYSRHFAIVVERSEMGDALVIVSLSGTGVATIQDVCASRPDPDLLAHALEQACIALRKQLKCHLAVFSATEDSFAYAVWELWRSRLRRPLVSRLRGSSRKSESNLMPRKITAKGKEMELTTSFWNITFAVAEGRP